MTRFPWFRLWAEARNDAKLRRLSDAQFRVWFNLLCFASEQVEARGTIRGYDDLLLAVEVANGDGELLGETLAILQQLRIVRVTERDIAFVNFPSRQYDKPSDAPEATRDRKRRSRERLRDGENPHEHAESPDGHANVTPVTPGHAQEEDTETEKEPESTEASLPPAAPAPSGVRDRFAESYKAAASPQERMAALGAHFQTLYGRAPDFGRLAGLSKKFGSGYDLGLLMIEAARADLGDDPHDYLTAMVQRRLAQRAQARGRDSPGAAAGNGAANGKRRLTPDEIRQLAREG